MEPAIAGALIGGGTTALVAIGAQIFGFLREGKQFRHARRLQNDADARAVLDEALAAAYDIRAALNKYAQAVILVADCHGIGGPLPDSIVTDASDQMEVLRDQIARIRHAWSRLTVRFGPDDVVSASYASILLACLELRNAADSLFFRGYTDELTAEKASDLHMLLDEPVAAFVEAAHAWATRE